MGKGMGAVEKAVERSQSFTGDGKYLPMIYWKDDDKGNKSRIVRFLDDDVIVAKFYEFVKGGKDNKGRDFIDPTSLLEEVEEDDGHGNKVKVVRPLYPEVADEKDYFVENNVHLPDYKGVVKPAKAAERTIGLAVLRNEKKSVENGKRKAVLEDLVVKREWEDGDGKKHEEEGLGFGVIKQGNKNFWATLVGYYNRYGTIIDRDYEIIRNGNNTDTTYVFLPLEPDPELLPKDGEKNPDGSEKTVKDVLRERYFPQEGDSEEVKARKCPMELKDWIIPKAKYEAAQDWLKGKKVGPETTSNGGDSGASSRPSNEEPDPPASEEKVRSSVGGSSGQSLREQLESYSKTS